MLSPWSVMNLQCDFSVSLLAPMTCAFASVNFGSSSVNSFASIVHPGVLSLG